MTRRRITRVVLGGEDMTVALGFPPHVFRVPEDLTPAAQVERDAALEAGEAPPCRAMVPCKPMPGDWCWWDMLTAWESGKGSGPYPCILRPTPPNEVFDWLTFCPDVWLGTIDLDEAAIWAHVHELRPLYRRWS